MIQLDEGARRLLGSDPRAALALGRDLIARAGEENGADLAHATHFAGRAAWRCGEAEAGQAYLADAVRRFELLGEGEAHLAALIHLGNAQRDAGQVEAALRTLETARALSHDDSKARGEVLNALAGISFLGGDYLRALRSLQEALELLRGHGDALGEVNTLSNLGRVYRTLGDYARALEHLEAAHALLSKHPGEVRATLVCLDNLGSVFDAMGRRAEAERIYRKVLEQSQLVNDRYYQAIASINLGNTCRASGAWDAARTHFERGAALSREAAHLEGEHNAWNGLGQIEHALGRFEQARRAYRRAWRCARAAQDTEGEGLILLNVGHTLLAEGRPRLAARAARAAITRARRHGHKPTLHEAHQFLSEVLERLGDFAGALEHHRRFYQLDKELFNEDGERKLRNLELHFELDRAKQELARLQESHDRDLTTGLLNRAGLLARYAALPVGERLAAVMIDLNGLKAVNDEGGHGAGDAYIQGAAQALRQVARPSDLLARWGGDEFVLLLPELGEGEAAGLLERAAQLAPKPAGITLPFAFGAAALLTGEPLERALALADARMYERKERQRAAAARGSDGRLIADVEELSASLARFETPAAFLEHGLPLLREVLGFEAAVLLERTGDTFDLRRLAGAVPQQALALNSSLTAAEEARIARRLGATLWSNDYSGDPDALAGWKAAGLKSYVTTPVWVSGRVVAALGLLNFETWRPITPSVRRTLEGAALHLGHALERAPVARELAAPASS